MPTKKQIQSWKEKGFSFREKDRNNKRSNNEELSYALGGFVLTRDNRLNETGLYQIRHYEDGMHIRSWRKNS